MVSGAVHSYFATRIYQASLAGDADFVGLVSDLEAASWSFAEDDQAGQAWCDANRYGGYTSYGSLSDLTTRATAFATLKRRLDRHATAFAGILALDLGPKGRLKLDSLWVSILEPGSAHSGHIHPNSVLSGTVYIATPPGSGGLRLEDPRLGLMMAAPPLLAEAPEDLRRFITLTPEVGTIFFWESWLRHEVLPNHAEEARVSISFNYGWA